MPHAAAPACAVAAITSHRYTGTLLCLKKPTSHPAVRHGGNILTYVRDGRNKAAPIPNSLPETTSGHQANPLAPRPCLHTGHGKGMRLGSSGVWPRLCGQRYITSVEEPPRGSASLAAFRSASKPGAARPKVARICALGLVALGRGCADRGASSP
jgi:hypothetical protein